VEQTKRLKEGTTEFSQPFKIEAMQTLSSQESVTTSRVSRRKTVFVPSQPFPSYQEAVVSQNVSNNEIASERMDETERKNQDPESVSELEEELETTKERPGLQARTRRLMNKSKKEVTLPVPGTFDRERESKRVGPIRGSRIRNRAQKEGRE
jgi:hypothetical protein